MLIVSVIKTESDNKKLPNGELTDIPAFTIPIVVMFPGTATGTPIESPPSIDTNPQGPALTPVPASTLVIEVIMSPIISPPA